MLPLNETPEQKIERIVDEYSSTLLRVALNQTSNKTDAEDAVQTVFLKLLRLNPEFASAEHEKAWLIRVTVNQCKDMMRSGWNKKTTAMDETLAETEQDDHFEVLNVVRTLPEKYRTVVYLYYFEGYSTAEIAALLETRQGTVESRLHRARAKLRVLLEGGWD
ncbi:sigma-70 family RNA polymerase sigma factor [Ruminococcaceae bacterium OttesenSCG-928-A16]|nr:sigma-70 family RNA polymerase sigma factor [Ruminococcaceae bacterium OttesenSCG-928-A16]